MLTPDQETDRRLERLKDAEQSVLGGCIIQPTMIDAARELRLAPEHFVDHRHRIVYAKLLQMSDRGDVIDLVTLFQALTVQELDEAGQQYVADLIDGVPQSTNVPAYARIVLDAARLRGLQALGRKILSEADSDETADAVLERAERGVFALRDQSTRVEIATPATRAVATFAQIEALVSARGVTRGVPTGLVDLDQQTRGMHAGNLLVLGARPSMGKSALGLTVAVNAAQQTGRPSLMFSLEMSEEELNLREIAMRAQVDSWRLSHGRVSSTEQQRLSQAVSEMDAGGVHVIDAPDVTVGQIRAMSRRVKAQHDLSVVVIDYLQLLAVDAKPRTRSGDTRTQELGEMTRALKILARDLGIPVLLLSQLSRANEARSDKRPLLSDLRESGSIEQDADVVWLLFRPWAYRDLQAHYPEALAELNVAKQRNGPTGVVKLAFLKDTTTFGNWTEREAA